MTAIHLLLLVSGLYMVMVLYRVFQKKPTLIQKVVIAIVVGVYVYAFVYALKVMSNT